MASTAYPPWSSAPSTLEGNRRTPSSPKWINNAKQAIMKPWIRRSQRKEKKKATKQTSPPQTPNRREEYNPNPFVPRPNPFAPRGGHFINPLVPGAHHPAARVQHQHADSTSSEEVPRGHFEPDSLLYKPTRPSLANVFPMYDSPQLTPTQARAHAQTRTNIEMRRHSTSAVLNPPPLNMSATIPESALARRPSRTSTSSDISNERSNRRERRAKALREIPILPNQPKVEKRNVYSSTPSPNYADPNRKISPANPYYPRQEVEYAQAPYSPYFPNHPQGRGLANSFSFPPWPQPHDQLLELEEELEHDEVDGAEGLFEESGRHAAYAYRKGEELRPDVHDKLHHIQEESEEGEDIKGFDSFMMY